MKEQIEEIAKVMCINYGHCSECSLKNIDKDDTCSVYIEAEALYNAGYRKQEWISVEDRLPDVLDDYLVVVKLKYEWETEWEYHTDVAGLVLENGYIDGVWDTLHDWNEGQECHVTHWMPLPEPPKMKGGAE